MAFYIHIFPTTLQVKAFNTDDFLRSLESCGPQLTSTVKGDWEGLYKRFFKSPNFVGWYSQRIKEVTQKLTLLHLESLAESRIESWMTDKEEVGKNCSASEIPFYCCPQEAVNKRPL